MRFRKRPRYFEKHRTEAGFSGTAFASIYSGSHAMRHSAFTHPTRLPLSLYDLTEAFADNGYEVYL